MIPNAIEKISFYNLKIKNINKKIFYLQWQDLQEKGFDLLPSIAKLLDEERLTFSGHSGHNSKNIQTIKDMKISKNFKYLDNIENLDEKFFPHNDLIKVYKDNHLYINLARIESLNNNYRSRTGLPVITFDTKAETSLLRTIIMEVL